PGPGRPPGPMPTDGGHTKPVDAMPYDPVKAMIQAQNKKSDNKIIEFIKKKKLLVIVASVLILLFLILTIVKFTSGGEESSKIDKQAQRLKQKQVMAEKMRKSAINVYQKAKGRPEWDKAIADIVKALEYFPKQKTLLKQKEIIESGKKLDNFVAWAEKRYQRIAFPSKEVLKKVEKAKNILSSEKTGIEDLLSDKAKSYYADKIKKMEKVLEKRIKLSGIIDKEVKKINTFLSIDNNKSSRIKAIKIYTKIINNDKHPEFKQCKLIYNTINKMVENTYRTNWSKKRHKVEFNGEPSKVDACRLKKDIVADLKAFKNQTPEEEKEKLAFKIDVKKIKDKGASHYLGGGMPVSAYKKYSSKDFSSAASEAKKAAEKNKKYAKAASKLSSLASAWSKAQSGSFTNKIKNYEKALALDKKLKGMHQAEIRSKIGKNAKTHSATLLASGKNAEAYRFYKKAKQYGASGVNNLLNQLVSKAKSIYQDGYKAGSDSDTAKDKYRQVLKMVPPETNIYKKAKARLEGSSMPKKSSGISIKTTKSTKKQRSSRKTRKTYKKKKTKRKPKKKKKKFNVKKMQKFMIKEADDED
ncbi:MAG: hypothetical protein ACQES9_07695, partial [Myxococcota bacterium]